MGIAATGVRSPVMLALAAVAVAALACILVLLKRPPEPQQAQSLTQLPESAVPPLPDSAVPPLKPVQPRLPPPQPGPLVLPFAADMLTGLTITIGWPFEFVFVVPLSRLPEFYRAMDGAESIPVSEIHYNSKEWGWWGLDPKLTVTLKDESNVDILMSTNRKELPFCLHRQNIFFESPKLVALVNETVHAGLMADLLNPDFEKKFKAAAALNDRGDSVGHDILTESLKSDKPLYVRAGAAIRLAKKHDPEALRTANDLAGANLEQNDGQRLVMAIENGPPDQVVPILRKFWLEGKFVLHDRFAIQALGKIGTREAADVLFEVWGDSADFQMALVAVVGMYFKPHQRAEATAWWAKNRDRPRMEILTDGYVSEAGGHGYGHACLAEMKKLDRAGAVKELQRRLPTANDYQSRQINRGIQWLVAEPEPHTW